MTQPHWWTSSVGFSIIIHVITLKLFLETCYWNWYMVFTVVFCFMLYYGSVLVMSTQFVSNAIGQPEIYQEFFRILSSVKAWICILLLPIIALIPDLTILLLQKIFFPTPTDAVMRLQQKNPNFVYEGFKDVFVPSLPDEDEIKRREQE